MVDDWLFTVGHCGWWVVGGRLVAVGGRRVVSLAVDGLDGRGWRAVLAY